jgi:hypothetical protein
MNKEEEEYPDHDLVEFEEYDTFIESLNHRYEEGELRVTRPYIWHYEMDVPIIYKMDEHHEWVVWKHPSTFESYADMSCNISLKIITNMDHMPTYTVENTDFVLPRINTALLSRSRTAKLRVKRAKPACIRREEE